MSASMLGAAASAAIAATATMPDNDEGGAGGGATTSSAQNDEDAAVYETTGLLKRPGRRCIFPKKPLAMTPDWTMYRGTIVGRGGRAEYDIDASVYVFDSGDEKERRRNAEAFAVDMEDLAELLENDGRWPVAFRNKAAVCAIHRADVRWPKEGRDGGDGDEIRVDPVVVVERRPPPPFGRCPAREVEYDFYCKTSTHKGFVTTHTILVDIVELINDRHRFVRSLRATEVGGVYWIHRVVHGEMPPSSLPAEEEQRWPRLPAARPSISSITPDAPLVRAARGARMKAPRAPRRPSCM